MKLDLFNTKKFKNPISIFNQNFKDLKKFLILMNIIRKTEIKIANAKKIGAIKGPVHLGVGQEAIAVGISQSLKKTDKVFGAHRSHSQLLALNPDIRKLFAEVLGKETGFSKSMGGSMHLFDQCNGFYGSTPIVAGTVSLAVGAAIASRMQNKNDISVSYIGDGAVEEGVTHESLNLAKVLKAPILFVIENNLFASHMHISQRQPNKSVSRFAIANHIPYRLVDGNDVVSISETSKKLINNIRKNKKPGFLELVTYRWYGHVDWKEDVDVGVKRSKKDIMNWKERDPIKRLSQSMINSKLWTEKNEKELNKKIDKKIENAWKEALSDPYPSKDAISKFVYSKKKNEKKKI